MLTARFRSLAIAGSIISAGLLFLAVIFIAVAAFADNRDVTILGLRSGMYDVASDIPSESVPDQIIIKFKPGSTAAEQAAFLNSIEGVVVNELPAINGVVVATSVDPDGVATDLEILAGTENDYYVAAAGDTFPTNDDLVGEQWALSTFDIEKHWADESDRVVAVIDSGVCLGHPDLEGRILPGYDFVDDDEVPQDKLGHGCAVAGIIAANSNNEIGIIGVSRTSQILPIRVLDDTGIGTYGDVAAGILWAVDNGADVVNLSLGGLNESTLLRDAVNHAVDQGVQVVAAAGNTGNDQVLYPAKYENVVAVGAVRQEINGGYPVASFSSTGEEIDSWQPGVSITSTNIGNTYKSVSGTSFATAFVAGGIDVNSITSLVFDSVDQDYEQAGIQLQGVFGEGKNYQ